MPHKYHAIEYMDKTYSFTEEIEVEELRYCTQCGKATKHTITDHGDWEHYKCKKCGNEESYKVR